jgi:hypothetical protein
MTCPAPVSESIGTSVTVACPKCGADTPEHSRFCYKCGHQLIVINRCPKCGKDLPAEASFCMVCGLNLIVPEIPLEKELTSSLPKRKGTIEDYTFRIIKPKFSRESITDERTEVQIQKEEEVVGKPGLPRLIGGFIDAREELCVATYREELDGYVKKIIENKAYIVFDTPGGPLERAVKLSRLTAINADHQGALIRLVVEERGASMNIKFENLWEKAISTWRDKIKDEDLEKYDLLKKFALPQKPSKPK